MVLKQQNTNCHKEYPIKFPKFIEYSNESKSQKIDRTRIVLNFTILYKLVQSYIHTNECSKAHAFPKYDLPCEKSWHQNVQHQSKCVRINLVYSANEDPLKVADQFLCSSFIQLNQMLMLENCIGEDFSTTYFSAEPYS